MFAPNDRLSIQSRGSGIIHSELDQHGHVVTLKRHRLESHLEQMDALLNGQSGNATAKLIQHALLALTASVLGAGRIQVKHPQGVCQPCIHFIKHESVLNILDVILVSPLAHDNENTRALEESQSHCCTEKARIGLC